jgi:hypothetical protein
MDPKRIDVFQAFIPFEDCFFSDVMFANSMQKKLASSTII